MYLATTNWQAKERRKNPEGELATLVISGEISDGDSAIVPVLIEAVGNDDPATLVLDLVMTPKEEVTSRRVSAFDEARFVKDIRPGQYQQVCVFYMGEHLVETPVEPA